MPVEFTSMPLPSDKALIKVDFNNAFNSIRRDKILGAVEDHIPELLPYVHSACTSFFSSILMWNDAQVLSVEGIKQGDPLGPMLFCLSEDQGGALGLILNVDKSEVVSHSESAVGHLLSTFPGLQYVQATYTILLGSPVGG